MFSLKIFSVHHNKWKNNQRWFNEITWKKSKCYKWIDLKINVHIGTAPEFKQNNLKIQVLFKVQREYSVYIKL